MAEERYARQISEGFQKLRFEQQLEREFRQHHAREMTWYLQLGALAMAGMLVLALLINNLLLRPPDHLCWWFNLYMGWLGIPGLLLFAFAIRRRGADAYNTLAVIATTAIFAGMFVHLRVLYAEASVAYPYASFLFVCAFVFQLSGLRFYHALPLGAAVVATQVGMHLALGAPMDILLPALFNISMVLVITSVGCYLLEHSMRSNFLARRLAEMQVTHDPLTCILNRRGFEERLDVSWGVAQRVEQCVAVLAIDIDHFKAYNDTFGHAAGDAALSRVAAAIDSAAGQRPLDVCARMGGEEFTVVLHGGHLDGASRIAERIRRTVEQLALPVPGNQQAHLSVSVGLAFAQVHRHLEPWDVLKIADGALYKAKDAGRNRVQVVDCTDQSALDDFSNSGRFFLDKATSSDGSRISTLSPKPHTGPGHAASAGSRAIT